MRSHSATSGIIHQILNGHGPDLTIVEFAAAAERGRCALRVRLADGHTLVLRLRQRLLLRVLSGTCSTAVARHFVDVELEAGRQRAAGGSISAPG
jgi:hypothetical protein